VNFYAGSGLHIKVTAELATHRKCQRGKEQPLPRLVRWIGPDCTEGQVPRALPRLRRALPSLRHMCCIDRPVCDPCALSRRRWLTGARAQWDTFNESMRGHRQGPALIVMAWAQEEQMHLGAKQARPLLPLRRHAPPPSYRHSSSIVTA
jgi:hypothetical protein